ncbi:MAG: amidohydrolase family protein [Myxococcota bacterium]
MSELPRSPQRLVLRNARLLDGLAAPRDAMAVVVEGERIAAVEPDAGVRARPGDRVVDLAGRTLMPGMFSCHFHSVFEGVTPIAAPATGLHLPPAYLALVAGKNARTALECGVTSVIGSSTAYSIDASLKQAIEDGLQPGPRMLAGSSELCATGDVPTGSMVNWHMDLGNLGVIRTADGPVGFQGLVRDEIRKGADVVKVSVTKGHAASVCDDELSLDEDELDAIVRAAHARGKRVRAHTVSKAGILACVRAGVDLLDHVDQLDTECIDAIAERDLTIVPSLMYCVRTLQVFDAGMMAPFLPDPVPPIFLEVMDQMREDVANISAMLAPANAAGVRIVTGDDYGTGYLFHGEYGVELTYYVKECGIAPLDALRWATRAGAEAMGRADELGTIEVGRLADLVVVDGDPVADIQCLESRDNVLAVLKGGVFEKDRLAGLATS